jgi:hypothetical protein
VPSAFIPMSGEWCNSGHISVPVFHVKSCNSCQIMSFMSNHIIHVKSCHSCQIMPIMSNHVIHVKSCDVLCHWDFPGHNSVKSGGEGRKGGVKYVFQGIRRQLRCPAEVKNGLVSSVIWLFYGFFWLAKCWT